MNIGDIVKISFPIIATGTLTNIHTNPNTNEVTGYDVVVSGTPIVNILPIYVRPNN